MNPYGYPVDPYGYPQYVPPVTTTTYVAPVPMMQPPVTTTTYMAPPMMAPPVTTTTYMAPPMVAPPMAGVPPGYPMAYGAPPPVSYNYPTGPQIPGINGYSDRSISGHKFRSKFKVRHENRYPF